MRIQSLAPIVAVATALVFAVSLPTSASTEPSQTTRAPRSVGGISAVGTGEVTVVPDGCSIALRVRARAKSIEQALTEFEGKRELFGKAMADFTDTGMTMESSGPQIGMVTDQNRVMRMNGEPEPAAPYEIKETIELRMPVGEDRAAALGMVAQIVAAAVDVEASLDVPDPNSRTYYSNNSDEQTGPITFTVSDAAFEVAYATASKAGFENAKKRATALAALGGRQLGLVTGVYVTKAFKPEGNASGTTKRSLAVSVSFAFVE